MFAKLVNDQRKSTNSNIQTLIVNGKVCETPEIYNGWAEHYAQLATPLVSKNFDEKHKELVKGDICHIESIVTKSSIPIEKISEREHKDALSKLKNNKAPDVFDLTSEHFKFAGHTLLNYLLILLNHMVDKKKSFTCFKRRTLNLYIQER